MFHSIMCNLVLAYKYLYKSELFKHSSSKKENKSKSISVNSANLFYYTIRDISKLFSRHKSCSDDRW